MSNEFADKMIARLKQAPPQGPPAHEVKAERRKAVHEAVARVAAAINEGLDSSRFVVREEYDRVEIRDSETYRASILWVDGDKLNVITPASRFDVDVVEHGDAPIERAISELVDAITGD